MAGGGVKVGPGSVVGFGVGGAAFIEALLALILGDRSEQTLGVVMGGATSALLLGVTIVGRQWQAVHATKAAALVEAEAVASQARSAPPTPAVALAVADQTPPLRETPSPPLEVPGGSVPT